MRRTPEKGQCPLPGSDLQSGCHHVPTRDVPGKAARTATARGAACHREQGRKSGVRRGDVSEKDGFFFIFTQLKSRFCFVCCLIFSDVSPRPPAPESSPRGSPAASPQVPLAASPCDVR